MMKMVTPQAATKPARTSDICSIPYFCPNCGTLVGEFVKTINGGVALDAGGWLISDASKHCHRCGRLIHFKAPKDPWPVLVARHLERMQHLETAP